MLHHPQHVSLSDVLALSCAHLCVAATANNCASVNRCKVVNSARSGAQLELMCSNCHCNKDSVVHAFTFCTSECCTVHGVCEILYHN